jgi:SAM-dependent methyltransferase
MEPALPLSDDSPLGDAVWHDVECGSYSADLPLWRELAAAGSAASGGGCELLELGCGTGRVSLAMATAGCRVTALDANAELVQALRTRSAALGLPISAVVADACSFQLPTRFDLVLAPMQLAHLLRSADERRQMLGCIAEHLKPGGRAALALLDPEDDLGVGDPPPVPDMREENGWVFASQPVTVRLMGGASTIEIERARRAVSPSGEVIEHVHSDLLAVLPCERLEREATLVGLEPEPRRKVPATHDHVSSVVVVLRCDG